MNYKIIALAILLISLNLNIFSQSAARNNEPLKAGAIAPDFTLTNTANEKITLSELHKISVLVFYRGYW